VVVARGGVPGRPLTIQGELGAVLHGGDLATGWNPEGDGRFRLDGLPWQAMHMTWDDRFVMYTGHGLKTAAKYVFGDAKGEDWDGIEVAFTSLGGSVWVRSRSGESPEQHDVTLAPISTWGGATVSIEGADHVVIRGFTIRGGDAGVYLKRASDCVIERNAIEHGKEGVLIHYGCHRVKVLDNTITLRPLGDMNWLTSGRRVRDHIVMMIKGDGRADHHGVLMMNTGHGHEIAHNKVFQHWDGIKAYSIRGFHADEDVQIVSQLLGRDIKVHHNIICETWDYAIEPMGGEVNAEYHHNLIYWSQGTRIKRIGIGPCFWYQNFYASPYRNVPAVEDRIREDPKYLKENAPSNQFYISDQNECLLYVYHNTFAGMDSMYLGRPIQWNSKNWWFLNNLCCGERSSITVWGGHGKDYHFHHNYLGHPHDRRWYEGYTGNVMAFQRMWPPGAPGLFADFRIGKDWPCREKGLDLSRPWKLDGVEHPALAGLKPGYFVGAAPDIGALQFGEDMPHVGPRPDPPPEAKKP
jgi:hypothetical protein